MSAPNIVPPKSIVSGRICWRGGAIGAVITERNPVVERGLCEHFIIGLSPVVNPIGVGVHMVFYKMMTLPVGAVWPPRLFLYILVPSHISPNVRQIPYRIGPEPIRPLPGFRHSLSIVRVCRRGIFIRKLPYGL